MKRFLSIALSALMLLALLAGCGGQNNTSDPGSGTSGDTGTPDAANGQITIEYWNSAEGAMATSTEYLVNQFNETVGKEKGIFVNSVFQGGDVVEKLKTLVQANDYKNFPDVGQIYAAGLSTVLQMENLVTLDAIYSSGEYEISLSKDDIYDNFLRSYTYEGQLISLPLNASTMLMYYNKDAARDAGLDPDAPPATIAELAEWTDKLTVREGNSVSRYGLNLQMDRYELVNFLAGVSDTGCNYIGDNGGGRDAMMTKLTIGEDGSLMTFLDEWEKIIATGGYKAVNDDERGEFANGLSAINFQSSAQLAAMTNNADGKFELGVAALPACSAGYKAGAAVGGGSIAMFDKGDAARRQAAWEFMQFMASADSQMYLFEHNGYLPVCKSAYESDAYKAFIAENPNAAVAVEQLNNSDPGMQEPMDLINWEMNTLCKENFIAWTAGEITKQECHDNIVDGFNAKLTEYIRANG
ncbi:MAG: extracellular solute-binding protein [Oscillospiraceae bacterium]|nr:extracellular solute-binding protein [Oscillospiraceae bacterium]